MAIIQVWIKKQPHQNPTLQQLIASWEIPVTEWVRRERPYLELQEDSDEKWLQLQPSCICSASKKAFISAISGQKRKSFIAIKANRITCFGPLCETGGRYKTAFIVYFDKLNFFKWVTLVCFNFVSSFSISVSLCALVVTDEWIKVSQLRAWQIKFKCVLQNFPVCKDCVIVWWYSNDENFKPCWRLKKPGNSVRCWESLEIGQIIELKGMRIWEGKEEHLNGCI